MIFSSIYTDSIFSDVFLTLYFLDILSLYTSNISYSLPLFSATVFLLCICSISLRHFLLTAGNHSAFTADSSHVLCACDQGSGQWYGCTSSAYIFSSWPASLEFYESPSLKRSCTFLWQTSVTLVIIIQLSCFVEHHSKLYFVQLFKTYFM